MNQKKYKKVFDTHKKIVYNADVTRIKGLKMDIIYNKELNGFQIILLPNRLWKKEAWNKPINNKIYESWDDAMHYIDKCAE